MYGIIYEVKNKIDNKKYIGKTIRKLSLRKSDHLSSVRNHRTNGYLHNAIRKYGEENFEWYILEKCKKEELGERERFWIIKNNSHYSKGGYNLTEGGENNDTWTDNPNIEKMRKKVSGKNHYINKMTYEEREKHLNKYKRGKNNPSVRFRGMTYEEMYGEEVARKVKKQRSIQAKKNVKKWKEEGYKWVKGGKYIVKHENGLKIEICNLTNWCKENNIPRWAPYYSTKNNKPYKGWSFIRMEK